MTAAAKQRFWKEREKEERMARDRKLKKQHAPVVTASRAALQLYDYILVIDFEATCHETNKSFPNEIIEFPVVVIDTHKRQTTSHFHRYVKPVIHPQLTCFCTTLTGITQDKVDAAATIDVVLNEVVDWVTNTIPADKTFIFAADGPFDFQHFLFRCHGLRDKMRIPDMLMSYLDIRETFHRFFKVKRKGTKLIDILHYFKLKFQGQWHCGMDDARNIARIALTMMDHGVVFRIPVQVSAQWQDPYLLRRGGEGGRGRGRGGGRGGQAKAIEDEKEGEGSSSSADDDEDSNVSSSTTSGSSSSSASSRDSGDGDGHGDSVHDRRAAAVARPEEGAPKGKSRRGSGKGVTETAEEEGSRKKKKTKTIRDGSAVKAAAASSRGSAIRGGAPANGENDVAAATGAAAVSRRMDERAAFAKALLDVQQARNNSGKGASKATITTTAQDVVPSPAASLRIKATPKGPLHAVWVLYAAIIMSTLGLLVALWQQFSAP